MKKRIELIIAQSDGETVTITRRQKNGVPLPETKLYRLNWSPFSANPLDYIHNRTPHVLVAHDSREVKISQSGTDFVVTIGDERIVTGGNINTCYVLNQRGVGIMKRES